MVFEKLVDCVIKLDVSNDSWSWSRTLARGSLLISLLFPSDIVIDIRRPVMLVSYSSVVVE